MQQVRILVTGAAGFIGSHLVERLLQRGDVVVGVDNLDPLYSPELKKRNIAGSLAHPGFTFIEADCTALGRLQDAIPNEQCDVIVHLAAKAGVRPSIDRPLDYALANTVGTHALLEFARQRGVKRFVFGSSSSVYGNNHKVPFSEDDPVDRPISPYAATKRAGELLCSTYHHLFGIGVLALRYFTVYGPRQRPDLAIRKFGTLMLEGQPVPMYGDGSSERDYTWIDDIIDGTVAAVDRTRTHPGEFEIINLGESQTTSLRRLIELLAQALNVTPNIEEHPPQPGDVMRTFADVTKARRLLGYQPSMPIEEGIPKFVEWLRAEAVRGGKEAVEIRRNCHG